MDQCNPRGCSRGRQEGQNQKQKEGLRPAAGVGSSKVMCDGSTSRGVWAGPGHWKRQKSDASLKSPEGTQHS